MRLSSDQMYQYERDGFLVLENLFSVAEVEALRAAFEADARVPGPQRVLEDGSDRVRAVYASHERRPEFAELIRTPRLLGPVRALLSESVYLYQMKINAKPPFGGDKWGWHQDYLAWQLADQLPAPKLINVTVLLDEATEFNGPLIMVPGSHADGLLREDRADDHRSEQHLDPDDIALGQEELAALAAKHGFHSIKAPAGSVVFFHPEIVHGSAPNMSPFPRRLFIATYNATDNVPLTPNPRPRYLVGRDVTPLEPLEAAR
ncbi:phytanoyl-CoA dioxygenase family protein [Saccharothrix longispora]|uniref:phytanoyl-CoA dioxygenase family protein n=1 Tax=Saccharothrix longispora TaxID=33920 RepID=UPI0028FD0A06|nr:phytanoyl-CoA dioxygenase family protein [Saccharothrix longispora]MDU0293748.1 phytanoyl-CoA dioxygenase family protein [Saccharothrix longispora]